jgi:hypothetical protein
MPQQPSGTSYCKGPKIESTDILETSPCTVTIFTNSRIALDSLKNINNHGYLIEEIRKRVSIL